MTTLRERVVPWMRRWGLLAPAEPELLSIAQRKWFAKVQIVTAVISALFDLGIYAALEGRPAIRQGALDIFTFVNVPALLIVSAVGYFTQLRPERPWAAGPAWMCGLTAFTTVVWIQLTGAVSSYFIMMAAMELVLFRAAWGWNTGYVSLAVTQAMHIGAFVLEELDVLPETSLLTARTMGLESLPAYRYIAISSIVSSYNVAFLATSAVVARLKAQRRELERVRRDLAGMADGVRHGRLSGTEIGRWFVDELLGRGGMGEVYAAHDENGRQVAIKVLYPHLVEDELALSRFEREQKVASQIPGEHFPKLVEVARSEDGTPYIVMERLFGEDLGALLRRRGRLSIDETRALVAAIARALDALHALGVVHRDLTPANVFLVASSEARWPDMRLLDLGVCKLHDADSALTQTSMVLGTPGFMAPEQITGPHASIGPHTDVFACAAIAYRALLGEAAFAAGSLVQAIENVCRKDPIWPTARAPELPCAVDDVFKRALAKQPERRYRSASEFSAALASALTPS